MIDKAAEMSTSGLAPSRYSATSWDKNSYETVVRPGGNICKSPRRIRMLPAESSVGATARCRQDV
jgi:hypothetical protein